MDHQPVKRLDLVRGLPGSGRTTLARQLAADTGKVLAHEEDLPRAFSPLSPVGMAIADGECIVDTAREMAEGIPHLVIERVFPQAYTMRELARLAAANGYEVGIHEPQTEWAQDPSACLQHTSRPVSAEDMVRVSDAWEPVRDVAQVLASPTPSERMREAKLALAELHFLKEQGRQGTELYGEKFAAMAENFPAELGRLQYLGYFDRGNERLVQTEFAHLLSTRELATDRSHFIDPTDQEMADLDRRFERLNTLPSPAPEQQPRGLDLN